MRWEEPMPYDAPRLPDDPGPDPQPTGGPGVLFLVASAALGFLSGLVAFMVLIGVLAGLHTLAIKLFGE
jgi:hypothetical protein